MTAIKLVTTSIVLSMVLTLAGFSLVSATAGDLVLDKTGTVYYINQLGQRRGFPSREIFFSHGFKFSQVRNATAEDLNLPIGSVMSFPNGVVIKAQNSPTVYLMMNNVRVAFSTPEQFFAAGFNFKQVINLKPSIVTALPSSAVSPESAIAGATIVNPNQ